MSKEVRKALAWKLALYYGALLVVLLIMSYLQPAWLKYLPVGGLGALEQEAALVQEGSVLENLLATRIPLAVFDDAMNLISALAGVLIVMIPLRWVYLTEGLKKSINPDVASGLLLLPMVVTAIVFIVKFSLPLAFALTGIFAGVRYRTTLKNQADAYFTFACIAVGLAAGIRALGIGVVLAIFFAFTILISSQEVSSDEPDEGQAGSDI